MHPHHPPKQCSLELIFSPKSKELGDVSKSDMAKACGYVSTKKDGGERINFTSFYEALLSAKGIELGGGGSAGHW